MSGKPNSNPPASPHWLLRRGDQAAVAVLVLLGFGSMVGWWIAQGGLRGRLIEIDRAEPLRASFQVDINRADWPELAQLPGIGETLARRIVESRRRDGPFLDHQDLNRVHGIGPKTLEEIRLYLLPLPPQRAVAGQQPRSQKRPL
jgi:competence protein ComEA